MAGRDLAQLRLLGPAAFERERTARIEYAARHLLNQARQLPCDHCRTGLVRLDPGDGRKQRLGIRVFGRGIELALRRAD